MKLTQQKKQEEYDAFLRSKQIVAPSFGFSIERDALHVSLKRHQLDSVVWGLAGGRRAWFLNYGMGKSRISMEAAKQCYLKTGKKCLIVCPLGVRHQFTHEDGPALGMDWQHVRDDAEILAATSPYLITNYERVRDGNIDPRLHDFGFVHLDEGDILRNLGSKTFSVFIELFAQVPYRFVATATPSPNNYLELINYAVFLGVTDRGQILTRFFKRDSSHAGNLQLMPSQEEEFWLWVSTWALFIFHPSDLGYDEPGYDLPPLNIHYHRLEADQTRAFAHVDNRGQRSLILDAAGGVSHACEEKRETLPERMAEAQRIIAESPDDHFILWHHLEPERMAIEKAIPDALTIYGSLTDEEKEKRILQVVRGEVKIAALKPQMNGSGCNLQHHCHKNIFLGVDYKAKDFMQAQHRTFRFIQRFPVDIHIIYSESEDNVINALKKKLAQHNAMVERMREIVRTHGLTTDALKGHLARKIGVDRIEVKGKLFTAIHNDCTLEAFDLPDNSVDMILTSIPFGNHYEYTTSYEDYGFNENDARFWEQMDFLIPELLRVIKPGRIAAIHVKDRILYGHQTPHGFMEIDYTTDDCARAFAKHGWLREGRRTVVTDVVRENSSTYRLGWGEVCKDSTKIGSGLPEYILLFRKQPTDHANCYADERVTKSKAEYSLPRWQPDAQSFWRSNGNSPLTQTELYDYEAHVRRLESLAAKGHLPTSYFQEPPKSFSPWVWDDVNFMQGLNGQQYAKGREPHICPLPYDIVRRLINLYSNTNDLIYDPFGGLGTVGYIAMEQHRRAILNELNPDYFKCQVGYCKAMEEEVSAPTLFDYLKLESIPELQAPQPA